MSREDEARFASAIELTNRAVEKWGQLALGVKRLEDEQLRAEARSAYMQLSALWLMIARHWLSA